MKKCPVCLSEFNDENNRGSERIYCSKKCSGIASRQRYEKKMIEKYENEQKKINGVVSQLAEQPSRNSESLHGIQREENSTRYNGRTTPDFDETSFVVKYYEKAIENNFHKLRVQQLEEKVKFLENEIFVLESELDEIDEVDDKPENTGILGSILEQFKSDPVNSIKFASALFDSLKTPKNEKA